MKKIKVGLLIDEFFGGAGTGFGGYGFLARYFIAKCLPNAEIQVDVLLGKGKRAFSVTQFHEDNVNLYGLPRKKWFAKRWLKKQKYDVYLSVELTNDWVLKNETNPDTKLILWIQDPRPQYEWDEIKTMTLMPEPCYYNQRIYDLVHQWYQKNRIKFITQAKCLNQKAIDLYNLDEDVPITYVPNPIEMDADFDVKTYKKHDKIIFLGRLEDVKRGWLFCEIAKKLPEYEFYVLGKANVSKEKGIAIFEKYKDLPNLHFEGLVVGEKKKQFLKEAKILINTSIHEALPVSFLEALSYGVCLVSNRNPDSLTEKFGVWTGDVLGDGFDKVDLYVKAVKKIMENEPLRQEIAQKARDYVLKNHNIAKATKTLRELIMKEGGKCLQTK